MTWFAELLVVLAAAAPDSVPARLAERVRDLLARRWNVPADAIRLEWGRVPSRAAAGLADSAAIRVAGRDDEGRFVVFAAIETGGEIALGLRAGSAEPEWVAARPLAPGDTVSADDLSREPRTRWGRSAGARGAPLGWVVRRALSPGDRLAPPAIVEPPLIRPGDVVRFRWSDGAVMVERDAVAANEARRGDRVWARDRVRGERIVGIATGRRTAAWAGARP
jgi:flagella basal body P-ring formation protein FlgA